MKNGTALLLFIVAALVGMDLAHADTPNLDSLDRTVLLKPLPIPTPAPMPSVVKTLTTVATKYGDVTIEPSSKVHYDVNYQIGRGPIQNARLQGDTVMEHLRVTERSAHDKKQDFALFGVTKLAK